MAASRSRRANAGNKMSTLLDSEEVDEFYSTTYGGFDEEAEDKEYITTTSEPKRQRLKYSSQKDRKIDDDKQRQTSDDEDENNDEEDDDDSVDSDFSIDEDDEPRSDLEDEAKAADALNRTRPKRGQGVQTKAYKEPKRDKDKKIIRNERALATLPTKDKKKSPSRPQLSGSGVSSPKSKVYTVSGHSKPIQSTQELLETGGHRKLTRATTVTKTAETAKRQKERLLQHRKLLKRRAQLAAARKDEMRPLTQAEILEEAKITEKLNLESLKRFQEMELEARKKARNTNKRSLTGPYISYVSTSMPLIQEVSRNGNVDSSLGGNSDDRICVDDEYEDEEQSDKDQVKEEIIDSHTDSIHSEKQNEAKEDDGNEKKDNNNENEMQFRVDSRLKQERTFVTFSDFDTFRNSFPGQKRKEPVRQPIQQKVCPITRLPAKYFDPVTRLPYANLQAFRILREAYYTQLELKGDRNDPEIKEWIEWRQKCKGTNVLSNKNSVPVSKSNVIQQLPNANTPSSVLLHVSRPPAAFSHLLATNNPASTNVISQQSNPVTTTLPSSISSPNIVLKSQVVSNSLANTAANMNNTVVCTPTLANQQITTLTTSGNIQQGTVMTTTTPQRGLSALAVAVRQQHLQHQQQQLLQQQQQQIIANFVTTISPVSANAYLTTVTSTQSQNRAATGVQVVASSARNQLQQSVVLPVRTTPLTVQTPQSSGLPITQVIQNPTIQVASGGTMSTTPSGGISASVANQLPQQPATIQTHQSAGTIQTVKIAGQTQVNLAGIPRTMATTTLTSQQLQQLANSRGQLFSSALQSALRGVAVNAQGQRTTTQLIARPAPASGTVVTGAAAIAAIGSSPGQGLHTAMLRSQQPSAQQRHPHTATIALQRPIGVSVASTGSGNLTPTLTVTSSQLASGTTGVTGNHTPISLAVSNQHANVSAASGTRGIVTPHGTIRTVVAGTTSGSPSIAGHQIIMTQASGQSSTTASGSINAGSPLVHTARQQQIVVATAPGQGNTNPVGTLNSIGTSGSGPSLTRQIVVSHVGGNSGASTGLRSGQILQVTGQGGQQQQIVVSQSGQIILNPSVTPKQQ